MKNSIFRGGIPTRPDVEAMQKAFAERKPGDLITYQEVADLIKEPVKSSRMRGVFAAYRKWAFRNQGMQFVAEPNVGYRIMTAHQAVTENVKGLGRVSRAAKRVSIKTDAIDATALDDAGRSKHALLRRHAHAIEAATRDATLAVAKYEPPRSITSDRVASAP